MMDTHQQLKASVSSIDMGKPSSSTGHCGLRKHMTRIGIAGTAECQCGSVQQTPIHILQCCPNVKEERQTVKASDVSFQ